MEQIARARISPYNDLPEVLLVGEYGWYPIAPFTLATAQEKFFMMANTGRGIPPGQWLGYDKERRTAHLVTDL